MTNEEKQILLKDLCMRLPYGVKVKSSRRREPVTLSLDVITDFYIGCSVKPYLRPMSSMTEEEKIEFSNIFSKWFDEELFFLSEETFLEYALSQINYSISHELFDWLTEHHFDYSGLIPMGLALKAKEGMYN